MMNGSVVVSLRLDTPWGIWMWTVGMGDKSDNEVTGR